MSSDDSGDSATHSSCSRRRFIQGLGAGSTIAVSAAVPRPAGAQLQVDRELAGRPTVAIRLRVNGARYRLRVETGTTLLDALRNHLDLTGTKRVCDRAECGACTVLLDGRPVYACTKLAVDAQDEEITTIEFLSATGDLHPLQQAFLKHDALQCGYCTPGMVMSLKALLDNNPAPGLEDVRNAVSGNLCRCGTYPKIFRAALDAAAAVRGK